MVTEAGKELLRNTINTANFHNKILEQNEMWKQWEIERGLTMMVSDDDILKKIRKNHRCSKHKNMSEWKRSNSNSEAVAGTSSADRWDHSGFKELYPDDPVEKKSSSSVKERIKRWGHSGFHKLYPDEGSGRERSSSASSSPKSAFKKLRDFSSDEEQERPSSGRKCKKKRSQEECPDDIQERLLLLSKGKKCKMKCRRCRERLNSISKERDLILSDSRKNERKLNNFSYDELYYNERVKQRRMYLNYAPYRNKRIKRRSPSPPPKERIIKWDHDGFLELYPEFRKRKKCSKLRKHEA